MSSAAQLRLAGATCAAFYQVLARLLQRAPADWSEEVLTRARLVDRTAIALAFRQRAMNGVEVPRNLLGGVGRRVLKTVAA